MTLQKPMNVLHVTDSLLAGGAERVAVSLANALAGRLDTSHLCVTRLDGPLRALIAPGVRTFWLQRRATIDIPAFARFRRYLHAQAITHIHAHGTSLYLAALLKPASGCALIWHDHYGRAEQLAQRRSRILRLAIRRVDHIVCVNELLRIWATRTLGAPATRVTLLPNYADLPEEPQTLQAPLPGTSGKRIVCLAAFRPQKDHPTLLRAFQLVAERHPDWQLLLAGQIMDPHYARTVTTLIRNLKLERQVSLLGVRTDVGAMLQQCTLGVLASTSEGMPVALLEYGATGLPVVATRVGHCAALLQEGAAGLLVPPSNPAALSAALLRLIENPAERATLGAALQSHIRTHYSKDAVVDQLLAIYRRLGPANNR